MIFTQVNHMLAQHFNLKPKGLEIQDVVVRLNNKSLYGQVTPPKLFWESLLKRMRDLGLEQSKPIPCLFIHKQYKLTTLNYCDDQIWLGPENKLIEECVASSRVWVMNHNPNSERRWGKVKHLKTGQRAHLSSAMISKSATICHQCKGLRVAFGFN
jgi:hypothetical protein